VAGHPREERTGKFSSKWNPFPAICKNFEVGIGANEIGAFCCYFFCRKKSKKGRSQD